MCFGDPWEGAVPVDQVVTSATLLEMGCYQLSLGDTIGVGTPGQVTDCWLVSPPPVSGRPARGALPRHLRAGTGEHLSALAGASR